MEQATVQFQGCQDNHGFHRADALDFQQVMNSQLTQLIRLYFTGRKEFPGQIHCIFFPGTLVDQDSQQFGIGEVFCIFT